METVCFISYSRDELSFAESLARQLSENGCEIWIDFYRLKPGLSWKDQIQQALENTKTVLLIVSERSIASQNVYREWSYALEQGKRVILLVFQAVPIPPENIPYESDATLWDQLKHCEWVDFRQKFKVAFTQLLNLLDQPQTTMPQLVPMSGFAMPPAPTWFRRVAWLTKILFPLYILGFLFVLLSWQADSDFRLLQYPMWGGDFIWLYVVTLGLLASGFIALYFYRLPAQIPKRSYRYYSCTAAGGIGMQPVFAAIWFYLFVTPHNSLPELRELRILLIILGIGLLVCLGIMNRMIAFSHGMYRWSGPGGYYDPRTEIIRGFMRPLFGRFPASYALNVQFPKRPIYIHVLRYLAYTATMGAFGGFMGGLFDLSTEMSNRQWTINFMIGCVIVFIVFGTPLLINQIRERRRRIQMGSLENRKQQRIVIEHSLEDIRTGKEIEKYLKKAGHAVIMLDSEQIASMIGTADVVLVLVSQHKTSFAVDFEKPNVVPIFLEDIDLLRQEGKLDDANIRWSHLAERHGIDFKFGLQPAVLTQLAKQLHDPVRLIQSLESFPSRWRVKHPNIINTLVPILWFIGWVSMMALLWVPNLFYQEPIPKVWTEEFLPEIEEFLTDTPGYLQYVVDGGDFDSLPHPYNIRWQIWLGLSRSKLIVFGEAQNPSGFLGTELPPNDPKWCFVASTSVTGSYYPIVASRSLSGEWYWMYPHNKNMLDDIADDIDCRLHMAEEAWTALQIGLTISGGLFFPFAFWQIGKRLHDRKPFYLPIIITLIILLTFTYFGKNNFFNTASLFAVPVLVIMIFSKGVRNWHPKRIV